MALSLLRQAAGRGLCSSKLLCGKKILSQVTPTVSVLERQISVSPALKKRLYGPETDAERHPEMQHWINERYIAVALIPIIPLGLMVSHPISDTILTGSMILHVHWRLRGVAEDYIHGELLPRIAQPLVCIMTVLAFGSICYFNYTDVGFVKAVHMLYSQL